MDGGLEQAGKIPDTIDIKVISGVCGHVYDKLSKLFRMPEEKIKSMAICETVTDVLYAEVRASYPAVPVRKMCGQHGMAKHYFLELGEGDGTKVLDASWTQFVSDRNGLDPVLYISKAELQDDGRRYGIPESVWLRTKEVPVNQYNFNV